MNFTLDSEDSKEGPLPKNRPCTYNYNGGLNILRLSDTIPNFIFITSEVKQNVIINKKHGICELPHQLPNDLSLRILRNYQRSAKSQNIIEL